MENKVKSEDYGIIRVKAMNHTTYLKGKESKYHLDRKEMEASCYYLYRIICGADILDSIALIYEEVRKSSRDHFPVDGKLVSSSQFLWARICIVAYYFYRGDALWENFLFGKLEELISEEKIKQDIAIAKECIDKHYLEKEYIKNFEESSQPASTQEPVEKGPIIEDSRFNEKGYCIYIDKEAVKKGGEFSLDDFESLFRAAAMGKGPDLAAFLKKYDQNYLDMKGHSKKAIYTNLKNHFEGGLNYSYQNFTNAY